MGLLCEVGIQLSRDSSTVSWSNKWNLWLSSKWDNPTTMYAVFGALASKEKSSEL